MSAMSAWLPDGRLHLQHGPIDLVISIDAPAPEAKRAAACAIDVFPEILPSLVAELSFLRRPVGTVKPAVTGPIAKRMAEAVWPWRQEFVTPMAAVAGAVGDHVLVHMRAVGDCRRIIVNNGGDIAFHLGEGQRLSAGIVGNVAAPSLDAWLGIDASEPIRGIATSGWRGRSQSRGIADAVTILAVDAATADAAATMIANAVNIDHPLIRRLPASQVKDDSDLGNLPVTVAVDALPETSIEAALDAGAACAREALERGLIAGAYLRLQGHDTVVAAPALKRLFVKAA